MNDIQPFVPGQQTPASPTILVIDDQLLLSSALAYTLRDKGFDAHSIRVTSLAAVRKAARAHQPGLVLLDLDLGASHNGKPIEGVDLIAPLRALGWTVMVLTGTTSLDRIAEAVDHGAANWIVKGTTYAELVDAAVQIMQGRGQLLPAHRAALMERYRTMQTARQEAGAGLSKLTPREREVLARLADGLSAASIAAESYTSIHTVRTHIRTIFTKLEVNTQAAAIALAVQHPSLPIPPKSSVSRRRHALPKVQSQYAGSCEPDDKGRA